MNSSCRHPSGFTLIELMVVVAIIAIMAVIAVPSMVDLIQTNRVTAEVNSFVGDLQFARSEAIKQGVSVSVCASSNGAKCTGVNDWQYGWIVFADLDGSGTLDAGDILLRKRPGWMGGDTFAAKPSMALTYSQDGFANMPASSSGAFMLLTLHTAPANDRATRCVYINRIGRQTVLKNGAGPCV